MNLDLLARCYASLAPILSDRAEPFTVTKLVEQHRHYWRPNKPRLILLAESHVHTSGSETNCLVNTGNIHAKIPDGFVRLVYCLGYGENKLLQRPADGRNPGTPQFWKIFASCTGRDFGSVLVTRNKNPSHRLAAKIEVLERLQSEGIWLLDASVAALYPKPSSRMRKLAIRTCWHSYIKEVISDADPQAILCIGVEVARILEGELNKLTIPWDVVPQPQARLSASDRQDILSTYYDVARDSRSITLLARKWLGAKRQCAMYQAGA